MSLWCVPPDDIPAVWPLVAEMIDSGYAELDEPTPDVRAWLVERRGLLWVYAQDARIIAAGTSSLIKARHGLALRMVAGGGKGVEIWKGCIGQIEDYARAEGCYKVIFDGRPGWGKFLSDYARKCVSFEKRI